MSHSLRIAVTAWIWLALLPAAALAQSSITGVVRDSSGGVLPGVTVEAASDALIEGMRSAITDDQGLYRLVDLRPGTYNMTFSLPGFNSFKREGLQLAAEFTATINAELRVGALEESIIVTGAAPVVDVTTAARAQVLDREAIDSIPDRAQHSGHGAARARRQPEPARHRRRPRHAADLHVDTRHDHGQHDDARGRASWSTACRATAPSRATSTTP